MKDSCWLANRQFFISENLLYERRSIVFCSFDSFGEILFAKFQILVLLWWFKSLFYAQIDLGDPHPDGSKIRPSSIIQQALLNRRIFFFKLIVSRCLNYVLKEFSMPHPFRNKRTIYTRSFPEEYKWKLLNNFLKISPSNLISFVIFKVKSTPNNFHRILLQRCVRLFLSKNVSLMDKAIKNSR